MTLILLAITGCTAFKSTVHLAQLEEAWVDAEAANAADRAVYEHTLAEQYRLKAREEWGYSDYGASQELALKSREYAKAATEQALYGSTDENAATRHEVLENLDEGLDEVPDVLEDAPDEEWIELDDIDLDDLDDLD
ncbi:MAG: hypothetical protein GY913_03730 [Proteobacteria bacterium]|nr:hypothetical protein [Pseudomonadota bacterium]MCP4916012.1 hypothetical protein [Pseudomonadota bacterium]